MTREVAELAGVTVRTVQRVATAGQMTWSRPGRDLDIRPRPPTAAVAYRFSAER